MKKRLTALLLAALLCLGLLPSAALAADTAYTTTGIYKNGAVQVTSEGKLTPNTNYPMIAVKTTSDASARLVALGTGATDGTGALTATITTGEITDVTGHWVYIYNTDGTVADDGPIKEEVSVTVSGTQRVGSTLTANVTGAPAGAKITYEWYRDDTLISGATGKTYTLTNADRGAKITVVVTVNGTTTQDKTGTIEARSGGSGGGGGGGSPVYPVKIEEDLEHGTVTRKPTAASSGDTVTLTVTPDEGYVLDSLTVTDKDGNELDLTDKGDGTFTFKMVASTVTVEADFVEEDAAPVTTPDDDLPFIDVSEDAWYRDAVAYVYDRGMMSGTAADTFSPDMATNRAMIVTILWRLEDRPAAQRADFLDVAEGDYYDEPVAWAAANGIVNGYGDTFGPLDPITREQLAAILYRYAAWKGCDLTALADLSGYDDADSLASWSVTAMQWAVENGLITGVTPTTLDPAGNATRAQVATILMRFCEAFLTEA